MGWRRAERSKTRSWTQRRGGRGAALREWENWAAFYIYLNLWQEWSCDVLVCVKKLKKLDSRYCIQFNSIQFISCTSRWLAWWFGDIGSELFQIRPTAILPNRYTTSQQPNNKNQFLYIHPYNCSTATQKLNFVSQAGGYLSQFILYNKIKIPQKLSSAYRASH